MNQETKKVVSTLILDLFIYADIIVYQHHFKTTKAMRQLHKHIALCEPRTPDELAGAVYSWKTKQRVIKAAFFMRLCTILVERKLALPLSDCLSKGITLSGSDIACNTKFTEYYKISKSCVSDWNEKQLDDDDWIIIKSKEMSKYLNQQKDEEMSQKIKYKVKALNTKICVIQGNLLDGNNIHIPREQAIEVLQDLLDKTTKLLTVEVIHVQRSFTEIGDMYINQALFDGIECTEEQRITDDLTLAQAFISDSIYIKE